MDAEYIRLAIARQPTVEQGIVALLRAVCAAMHDAVEDPAKVADLKTLQEHIDADPQAWCDAIFANTSSAHQTAGHVEPVEPESKDKPAEEPDYQEPPTAPPHTTRRR